MFDLIYLLLIIFTLISIFTLIRSFKKSYIGNFLIYSAAGTLFLGLIRLFFTLTDIKFLSVSDTTVMICWHLIFYLTMIVFLIATRSLVTVLDINNPPKSQLNPLYPILLSGLGIGILFYLSPLIDLKISPLVEGTWIDKTGVAHFIAFVFAASIANNLGGIKKKFSGSIGEISIPLIGALSLLSTIHLWELLGESWHLFTLPSDVAETVEKILWIPVFMSIGFAYWKLKKTLPSIQRK